MSKKKTKEEWLSDFRKVHGDKYDYSLFLDDSFVLECASQKIPIICFIHDKWNTTTIVGHSGGKGCPKCGVIKRTEKLKKTKEEWVLDFKKVHNDKYDYSLFMDDSFILDGVFQKIPIKCKIHGEWNTTTIGSHIRGAGCPKCGGSDKKTKEEWVSMFKIVHGYKYDYSLFLHDNFVLENQHQKIPIKCKIHGEWNTTTIGSHSRGIGCPKCVGKNKTKEEFVSDFKKVHGDKYDYSLFLDDSFVLKVAKQKIPIKCPIHGVWNTSTIANHSNSNGCPTCGGTQKKTKEEWVSIFNEVHNDKYDYSLFLDDNFNLKNIKQIIPIKCPIHGVWNTSSIDGHRSTGCPKCNSSKGELKIEVLLKNNNIQYNTQKKFKDCKYKYTLPFDFYLPKLNMCIEFDGEQHFKHNPQWGGKDALKLQQHKDQIKTKYCEDNGIKLLRIRYDENIEEKINDILKGL